MGNIWFGVTPENEEKLKEAYNPAEQEILVGGVRYMVHPALTGLDEETEFILFGSFRVTEEECQELRKTIPTFIYSTRFISPEEGVVPIIEEEI